MSSVLRLTNSEMGTWRRCKRKWYLGQYRGLALRQSSVSQNALAVGTRVHKLLAALYDPTLTSNDPIKTLNEGIEADILTHPFEAEGLHKDRDLCEAMITGYMEWLEETGVDEDIRVIAAETKLEVKLTEGVNLLTKLDTRVERPSSGRRYAFEFKTAGDLKAPLATLQLDTQLLTEHLAEYLKLKETYGAEAARHRADGVLYRMLKKVKRTAAAKPPFFAEEEVLHSQDELRNHWLHVLAIAHEITSARKALEVGADPQTFLYPNPTHDCRWDCKFLGACKLMNANGDVEGYLEEHFEVRDPLERYWETTESTE